MNVEDGELEATTLHAKHFFSSTFRNNPRYLATYMKCNFEDGTMVDAGTIGDGPRDGDDSYTVVTHGLFRPLIDSHDEAGVSTNVMTSHKIANIMADIMYSCTEDVVVDGPSHQAQWLRPP